MTIARQYYADKAEVKQPVFYWTYVYDGDIYDADFSCKNAAQKAADNWWAERCQDNDDMRNGEVFEEDIELIAYTYDDDNERKLFTTVKSAVEYEHYHGDMAEHGTWG